MCLLNYNKENKKYKHLTYAERTMIERCIHQASLYLGDCNIHGNDDKIWEEYIYDNIVKSRRIISKKLLENYNESNGYMKRKRLHRKK